MKRVIMGCLTIVFGAAAFWFGTGILVQQGSFSLHLKDPADGITNAVAAQMAELYDVAAYEETGQVTVWGPETGRKAEAAVIRTAGQRRLITGRWLKDGSFGLEDAGECLLSSGAALALFGNEAVAGQVVAAERKEWRIRGVLDIKEAVIMLPAEKETLMTNIEFQFSGAGDNQAEAEQACYKYGISSYGEVIDYGFFGALARLFLWLPFAAVLLLLKQFRKTIAQEGLAAAGGRVLSYSQEVLFWAGVLVFIFQAVRFPSGFIPAKWSDVSFWSAKGKEAMVGIKVLFTSAMMKDQVLKHQLMLCAVCSAAAARCLYQTGRIAQ